MRRIALTETQWMIIGGAFVWAIFMNVVNWKMYRR